MNVKIKQTFEAKSLKILQILKAKSKKKSNLSEIIFKLLTHSQ